MDVEALEILRGNLLEVGIATVFLVLGMAACMVAVLRRRQRVRLFLLLGIWSAAYGLMHLLQVSAVAAASPPALQRVIPDITTVIVYLMVVLAAGAWLELTVGGLRTIVVALWFASLATAMLAIGWYLYTGDDRRFMPLNHLLATIFLALLLITLCSKRLFEKYLQLPERGFLVFGTVVFTIEALYVNLSRALFGLRTPLLLDHLGFMVLLVAFGYAGLKMLLGNERRLLEIQAELEVAREIQRSILPIDVPQIRNLQVHASYEPAALVAGDFYEFLPVDDQHAGVFVADVCGHGVPAALIASMLKVAVQSVACCAARPGDLLATLNRLLAGALNGQLISSSYLWIDMAEKKALYSAAGHPPLLRCNREINRVESNGLLFGIAADAVYPEVRLDLRAGDRLLLYTDGVTEPENAAGEAFGDWELPRVLTRNVVKSGEVLSAQIADAIQKWRCAPEPQDDMTLIVVDVLE